MGPYGIQMMYFKWTQETETIAKQKWPHIFS